MLSLYSLFSLLGCFDSREEGSRWVPFKGSVEGF